MHARDPNWVPPLRMEVGTLLDRVKNPFFEHGAADYFLAERDGKVVAAIGAGDVVADLAPVTGAVRGATVQAVTPMRVLVAGPGTTGDLLDGFAAAAESALGLVGPVVVRRPSRVRRALGIGASPA